MTLRGETQLSTVSTALKESNPYTSPKKQNNKQASTTSSFLLRNFRLTSVIRQWLIHLIQSFSPANMFRG